MRAREMLFFSATMSY